VVEDDVAVLDELTEALSERDPSRALLGVAEAIAAGRDPQRLSTDLVEYLRQGFLAVMAPELVTLADVARDRVAEHAHRLGTPALVRAMEALGRAQVEMRDALDPRVNLEVTLIRLTRPEADDSPGALLERIDRLERRLAAAPAAGPAAGLAPDSATPGLSGGGLSKPARPHSPRPAAPPTT
ncbi:MAG: DNA polymerase III subunit gamma and tau, partial [Acidimicrobiales bacterium]